MSYSHQFDQSSRQWGKIQSDLEQLLITNLENGLVKKDDELYQSYCERIESAAQMASWAREIYERND